MSMGSIDAGRRQLVRSALASACLPLGMPAAAAAGRVLFGVTLGAADGPMMGALLQELRGRYQPDLGPKLAMMPGNGGVVAMEALHSSEADGSTALLAPSSMLTLLPLVRKLSSIDPERDFVPVAAFCEYTVGLLVGPAVPPEVTSAQGYVRWLKDNPIHLSVGALGIGGALHVLGLAMAASLNLPLRVTSYKSMVSIEDDLRDGNLAAALLPLKPARYAMRNAGVRLLAVASEQRWPGFDALPTMRELGLSQVTVVESLGFFMHAATPPAKVTELRNAVYRARQSPQVLAHLGNEMRPIAADAPDFTAVIDQERKHWSAVVKLHPFTAES